MARRSTGWTCHRVTAGVKCGARNKPSTRKCGTCGKSRPAPRRPAHLAVLDVPYERWVEAEGAERCAICGADPVNTRLHRDHDHRTGEARGLLCFRDNAALRGYMTEDWLRAALAYVTRPPLDLAASRRKGPHG